MPTVISPPISFGQARGDLGLDYVFAEQEIIMAFQDAFDPIAMGVVGLWGDLDGTGSDTMRVTYMDGVGLSTPMDALETETSPVAYKSIITDFSSLTVALYGLGYSETYVNQAFGRESAIGLDAIKAQGPGNYVATVRELVCAVGATFTTTEVGSAGAALTIADMIALQTIFSEKVGSDVRGAPKVVLHPRQVTNLRTSAAANAAYQNSIADFSSIISYGSVRQGEQVPNFLGLGFDVMQTNSVDNSGGAHRGFALTPGAIGLGRAFTRPIVTANPAGTIYVPQFGLIIEEITTGSSNAKRAFEIRALIGVAKALAGEYNMQVGIKSLM